MPFTFNHSLLVATISKPKVSNKQVQAIYAQLEEFRGLAYNWDSYQANAVENEVIDFSKKIALRLLEIGIHIDFCVPMRDGGIQFEFNYLGMECELEVKPFLNNIFSIADMVDGEFDNLASLENSLVYLKYNNKNEIVEKKELRFKELNLNNL